MSIPRRVIRDPEGLNTGSWPVPPQDFITPVDRFFTRSHAAVPPIDADSWRLEIGGLVEHPRSYSLAELMSGFTRRTVAATLVCAGLRREHQLFRLVERDPGEFRQIERVRGLHGPADAALGAMANNFERRFLCRRPAHDLLDLPGVRRLEAVSHRRAAFLMRRAVHGCRSSRCRSASCAA